jgi:aquaporin TIP
MCPTRFSVGRWEEALQANTIRAAVSELVATTLYVFATKGSTLALGTDILIQSFLSFF